MIPLYGSGINLRRIEVRTRVKESRPSLALAEHATPSHRTLLEILPLCRSIRTRTGPP